MTHPTKAIVPILFEEMRKGKTNYFSTQEIKNCMKKVTAVDLHQRVMVDNELEIKAYYAGHVLGAAMFWLKVGSQTVVYTGDFNMNPDRHLGAAWIDKCQPDLLITESMHVIANPNTKRCRNRDFLKNVHECMSKGGKVLIPVFILGRAQELCILLDTYWEKMNLSYPIYFATESFTEKANYYYKMFGKWTNQKMHKSNDGGNDFEFKHIKSFNRSYIDNPGPMVVLATNGMLQQGISINIFKKWAHDEKNMVIFPDVCIKGTMGYKIAAGAKEVAFGNKEIIKVQLKVEEMSFDAVADAKDIIKLIEACNPKHVILAHAKQDPLTFLKNKIMDKYKIECLVPTFGEECSIKTTLKIPTYRGLLFPMDKMFSEICTNTLPSPKKRENMRDSFYWILVMKENRILLLSASDALKEVYDQFKNKTYYSKIILEEPATEAGTIEKLFFMLKKQLVDGWVKLNEDNTISVESLKISVGTKYNDTRYKIISIKWKNDDEDIASYILYMLQHMS